MCYGNKAIQPVYGKSMFSSHQLQPSGIQHNQPHKTQPGWIPALLLLSFILLAWGQVFYHKRIQQIFRAPFSKRFINQLTRDGNLFSERISIAMGIVYIITWSLLVYESNEMIFGVSFKGIEGIRLYGIITAIIIGMLIVKVLLVRFLGIIFKTRETTASYLLNLLIFSLLSGPVLLMALVFIIYLKSVMILMIFLFVFAGLMVFRFLRGFFIGMALRKFSYLFLFVYLCSLEILPLVVLIKILLNVTHAAGA
jgi:hypothetical protein